MERLTDDTGTGLPTPFRAGKKVEILPGASADGSACTFCIHEEDHTLGNALRCIIMKNPEVEFCGYSAPHPSEPKIHLRVQMYDGRSAIQAVRTGLDNLETMILAIDEKYKTDLDKKEYETYEETYLDLAAVRKMQEGDREGASTGTPARASTGTPATEGMDES